MGTSPTLQDLLSALGEQRLTPLDVLPEGNPLERIISLLFDGVPEEAPTEIRAQFSGVISRLTEVKTSGLKVVVFGGGTGLSNIVGGDSRRKDWQQDPFSGLKEVFPRCHSIVCITDDGGSTGELLKDLPLIALGDLRHVLLSSVQRSNLEARFNIDAASAKRLAIALHELLNYRFITCPLDQPQLLRDTGIQQDDIPDALLELLRNLIESLFTDERLTPTLNRPQCLGNLLLAAIIYQEFDPSLTSTELAVNYQIVRTATIRGVSRLCRALGMHPHAVLPCTTTNSQLQVLYGNGVQVTGEHKSGYCRRGYPVDRVVVEFCRDPYVQPEVIGLIAEADILLFAPGSLYSSIIPIMQVPGIPEAIRDNREAMKLLITNIWVQKGETDAARDAPDRKFHVSDLIQAYHRNIPGGVQDLFSHVLPLNLADIPGSVLQRYALEDKEPIYLDRQRVLELGFATIAVPIYSKEQLKTRGIIQHDARALARIVRALYGLKTTGLFTRVASSSTLQPINTIPPHISSESQLPCLRYEGIVQYCRYLSAEQISLSSGFDEKLTGMERNWLISRVVEIIWNHPDISLEHLQHVRGVTLVAQASWKRCQEWDNVFSFYDPQDKRIKIRQDQTEDLHRFEVAFLVALGQSLLGNYALKKEMTDISFSETVSGRTYTLTLREPENLQSFFDYETLLMYLELARMCPLAVGERRYTRVINGQEGFTPPGLFFGLCYAWYLDNSFASNIEYKMSIMKNEMSDLIPEQERIVRRRQRMIRFFRDRVFHV